MRFEVMAPYTDEEGKRFNLPPKREIGKIIYVSMI
jgi:hypothetical protein